MGLQDCEKLNINSCGRIFVVSDLHGVNINTFQKFLNERKFSDQDLLIICGDIIDRGEHSYELIDFIKDKANIKMILGNHEMIFLCRYARLFLDKENENRNYLENFFGTNVFNKCIVTPIGPNDISMSFYKNTSADEQKMAKLQIIFDFLYNLPLCIYINNDDEDLYFVHAVMDNILFENPDNFSNEQKQTQRWNILWGGRNPEKNPFKAYSDKKTTVYCGHTDAHQFIISNNRWNYHNLDFQTKTHGIIVAEEITEQNIFFICREHIINDEHKQMFFDKIYEDIKILIKINFELKNIVQNNYLKDKGIIKDLNTIQISLETCLYNIKQNMSNNRFIALSNINILKKIHDYLISYFITNKLLDFINENDQEYSHIVDTRYTLFSILGVTMSLPCLFLPLTSDSYCNMFFSNSTERSLSNINKTLSDSNPDTTEQQEIINNH